MKRLFLASVSIIIVLSACDVSNRQQNYAVSVLTRPDPHNESERIVECGWLGGEIARQQNLGLNGGGLSAAPRMAAAYQIVTRDNITVLESRANYLRCNLPASGAPSNN